MENTLIADEYRLIELPDAMATTYTLSNSLFEDDIEAIGFITHNSFIELSEEKYLVLTYAKIAY